MRLVDTVRCRNMLVFIKLDTKPCRRPKKANPAYKGKWYAPMVDNPAYIGEWKPRQVPNPAFFEDLDPVKSLKKIVRRAFVFADDFFVPDRFVNLRH